MRVFVTGASGFVGSAVVPELIGAGHRVVGLARSDASAAALDAAGAEVHRGDLADLDSLRAGAADADGVVHLAFVHDFSDMPGAGRIDLAAIEAIGAELEGSGRPLVVTSGTGLLAQGRVATERDIPDPASYASHRSASELLTLELGGRGVRSSLVRLSPSVHDRGDHGFVPRLVAIAREKGVSGYVADGANRWPAVHRRDAAVLFRLAVEQAPAQSVLHAVGDEGIPTRTIAETIARRLGIPAVSVPGDEVDAHFGWLGGFFAADVPASSALTRELLDWEPTHPGLLEDLETGDYFDADQPMIRLAQHP